MGPKFGHFSSERMIDAQRQGKRRGAKRPVASLFIISISIFSSPRNSVSEWRQFVMLSPPKGVKVLTNFQNVVVQEGKPGVMGYDKKFWDNPL